jgi:hypothetical protein
MCVYIHICVPVYMCVCMIESYSPPRVSAIFRSSGRTNACHIKKTTTITTAAAATTTATATTA